MRIISVVILGMMISSACALAQEDSFVTATSTLQGVLATLKQSVQKLSIDNDRLAARDHAMKEQISQMSSELGLLQTKGEFLNNSLGRLQENNPRRVQQIAALEAENFGLDNRIGKFQEAVKLIQLSLDTGLRSPKFNGETHSQKEKLRLMKMIDDCQQRQEALQASIQDFQKSSASPPKTGALAHQQLLKEQIKALEGEESLYPPVKPLSIRESSNQWDTTQLHQLELELKSLEQNYSQLKGLMEQMIQKAQSVRMPVSDHVEGVKLQSNLDDLNHQGTELKTDLDDLRLKMIELDKRKSHLEEMIH